MSLNKMLNSGFFSYYFCTILCEFVVKNLDVAKNIQTMDDIWKFADGTYSSTEDNDVKISTEKHL